MGPIRPDPMPDPRGLQSFEKPRIAELPVENQRPAAQKIFHLSEQPRMLQIAGVESMVDRLFRVANKGRGNRPTSIGRTQHQWDGDLPPFPSSPAARRGRP
jgi:hypothetical protein